MKGGAFEEETTQDIGAVNQRSRKSIPFLGGAFTCHP